jgi:hypothetical protein
MFYIDIAHYFNMYDVSEAGFVFVFRCEETVPILTEQTSYHNGHPFLSPDRRFETETPIPIQTMGSVEGNS